MQHESLRSEMPCPSTGPSCSPAYFWALSFIVQQICNKLTLNKYKRYQKDTTDYIPGCFCCCQSLFSIKLARANVKAGCIIYLLASALYLYHPTGIILFSNQTTKGITSVLYWDNIVHCHSIRDSLFRNHTGTDYHRLSPLSVELFLNNLIC